MDPVAVIAILTGTVGTLTGVITFLFRQLLQRYDRELDAAAKRESEVARERDDARRERDVWRDRSIQVDRRLDRVAGILEPAPKPDVG